MKKKPKQQRPNISLSKQDVDAILCALPLISYLETDTPAQKEINIALATTATEKLIAHNANFVPNEIRVIYTAVACAANLEEFFPGNEIEPEWKAELRKHFFVLNRLYNLTKDYLFV